MNKLNNGSIVVILTVILLCVTLLIALGKDVTVLIGFLTLTIVPNIVSWFNGKTTKEVGEVAVQAKEAAEQAVHNTNGRMTEMLDRIAELTQTVQVLTAKDPTDSEIIEIAQHLKV